MAAGVELVAPDGPVDVVAVGKAAPEMADAAARQLGERVARRLVIGEAPEARAPGAAGLVVGEHPVPGEGSLAAGRRLVEFLAGAAREGTTLWLVSGGASSLCVLPQPPLALADLAGLWHAALAVGADIGALNEWRAAVSQLSGGAVLRLVRTSRSAALVMVDNVVSGPEWVASGLTYEHPPDEASLARTLVEWRLAGTELGERLTSALVARRATMAAPVTTRHVNRVLVAPSELLAVAQADAAARGYRVVSLGAAVRGDVAAVAGRFADALAEERAAGDPVCVLGVGEVTVAVRGAGRGGRCQQLAGLVAPALAGLGRPAAFVARASDGRDFLAGVAGAWVDSHTLARAAAAGVDWAAALERCDAYAAHERLGQLIAGGHTGWNLCDLYVACA
jgi:hydroxypyruvate reductase